VAAAAPLGDGRPSLRGIVAAVAIWAVTAGTAWFAWREERWRAVAVLLVATVVAWGLTFGAALPALEAPWIAPRLKEALFEKLPAGHGPVLIAGYSEPSAVLAFGTATRFGQGTDAAALLRDDPGAIAIVSDDQLTPFNNALAANRTDTKSLGVVEGFNYAKGRHIRLTLYRRSPS
jgi:hypothetical protein